MLKISWGYTYTYVRTHTHIYIYICTYIYIYTGTLIFIPFCVCIYCVYCACTYLGCVNLAEHIGQMERRIKGLQEIGTSFFHYDDSSMSEFVFGVLYLHKPLM